ncbi:MAG: sugar transferase [Ruminococcus sp.]|nr:sugar transferase [Ruminococcus sp.]
MQRAVKRVFDFCFALGCLFFALPVILLAMLVVHIKSPEDPVIFKQKRVGYKGKLFTIYKLRTMTNERDGEGNLLPDEKRLKKWGVIIRKTSIDELPQIFNILLGQMSWIGPRPLLEKEMSVMTIEEQQTRQSMLPGITGWEAINEGLTDTREAMAQYDLYYVNNWNLAFDIKIFFLTIMILFTGKRSDEEHRAPKVKKEEIKTEKIYSEK